ncbi:MAG: peptide-binding protein [Candidatus Wallbacteria bacterium]|nr:peptide-binding protein [Candidatus Wallbacteria bacterium]
MWKSLNAFGLKLLTISLLLPALLAAATNADQLDKALFEHYVLQDTASASADYKSFLNDPKKSSDGRVLEKVEGSYNELLKKQTSEIALSPSYGDTIVEPSLEPVTLNPLIADDTPSQDICNLIMDGLADYDKNNELIPELAESWEISADHAAVIYHLRKNVRWHDGTIFTAEDVKFTCEKIMDPAVGSVYRSFFADVITVEIIDSHTVRIACSKPDIYLIDHLSPVIIPRHIYEKVNLRTSEYNRHPIGTGPFRFLQWQAGEQIVLEANPDYYGGRPFCTRVIYKISPDDSMTFLSLLRGDIDMMGLTQDQFTKQANTEEFKKKFNLFAYPSTHDYDFIAYNLNLPLLKDRNIRQALTMAINRQEIIDKVLYGFGVPIASCFLPSHWACDKALPPFPYDPALSRKILAAAGWKDEDQDGILEKDGTEFDLRLTFNNLSTRKLVAELVRDYWKTVGIKVTLLTLEWTEYIKQMDEKKFQVCLAGWTLDTNSDPNQYWHSSRIPDEKNNYGGFNFISYVNPEVDRLCELSRSTFDREKLKQIYYRLQAIISEDQPYTFLYAPDIIWAVDKRIQGIGIAPAGIFYNFPHWYVPEGMQKYK